MTFHAEVHYEDGTYWAEVRELPGCFATGDDEAELREALEEAVEICLPLSERVKNFLLQRSPTVELEHQLVR